MPFKNIFQPSKQNVSEIAGRSLAIEVKQKRLTTCEHYLLVMDFTGLMAKGGSIRIEATISI